MKDKIMARVRRGFVVPDSFVCETGDSFSFVIAEWRGSRKHAVKVTFRDYEIRALHLMAKKLVQKRKDYAESLEGLLS